MSANESANKINTNFISKWNSRQDKFNYNNDSKLIKKIALNEGINAGKIEIEIKNRVKFLNKLVSRKNFDFDKLQKELQKYNSSI